MYSICAARRSLTELRSRHWPVSFTGSGFILLGGMLNVTVTGASVCVQYE